MRSGGIASVSCRAKQGREGRRRALGAAGGVAEYGRGCTGVGYLHWQWLCRGQVTHWGSLGELIHLGYSILPIFVAKRA